MVGGRRTVVGRGGELLRTGVGGDGRGRREKKKKKLRNGLTGRVTFQQTR